MKKDLLILIALTIVSTMIFRSAFSTFFAQDDFILIDHFSQNNFWQDFKNTASYPTVTHWRPLHSLYFLTAGNIFGKNYFGYHLLTFLVYLIGSFLVYKIATKIFKNGQIAFSAALIYLINPSHSVSLQWISGGATIIGSTFFFASFLAFLNKKTSWSVIFYILAFLASEAMVVGLAIFTAYVFLFGKWKNHKDPLISLYVVTFIFLTIRLGFLTSKETYKVYPVEISNKTFLALKYYLLRILGFAEVGNIAIIKIILSFWIAVLGILGLSKIKELIRIRRYLIFFATALIAGLFPFVLIPSHLSGHYMNLSIWGFAMSIAKVVKRMQVGYIFLIIFAAVSFFSVSETLKNNWVTQRANLAHNLLVKIEMMDLPDNSTLVFNRWRDFDSKEIYVALGADKAIDFWLGKGKVKTCFTFISTCPSEGIDVY